MTTTNQVVLLLSTLSLVYACGGSEEAGRPAPPPVEETVFKDMAGAVDKAHDVEDTTKQRTEQLNEALEASESR
jgi:hypothetical protein